MTPEDIRAIQAIWGQVLPIKDTAAQVFCKRLFETDPLLSGLYRDDTFNKARSQSRRKANASDR
jgi:hypothetical protein